MYHAPSRRALPHAIRRTLSPGTVYLGEDADYYYFSHPGANPALGGFFDNVGNMFTRMVKFTPKSFTPGNIYKGFVNTTLTVATAGAYQVLPKNLKKTVYEVGKIAIPVVAGGVVAVMAGPAVMGILGPKLAAAGGLLGKAAGAVGGPLFNVLGKFTGAQQAQIAQQVTPEQIAQMERTGQIPPELQALLNHAAAAALPSSGAASLYDPGAMAAREMEAARTAQAGLFGELSPITLGLLIGVPAVFFLFSQSGKK